VGRSLGLHISFFLSGDGSVCSNVVRFFGAGQLGGGQPFVVLELAELGSLREFWKIGGTRKPPLSVLRKLHIFHGVSSGMRYIHLQGHMHRDLKSGGPLQRRRATQCCSAPMGTARAASQATF
jgi:serine/threonine protein kinase